MSAHRKPTAEQRRARVHMRDARFDSGRHALCGTFSPRGLTDRWADVTCQPCTRHRPCPCGFAHVLPRLRRWFRR